MKPSTWKNLAWIFALVSFSVSVWALAGLKRDLRQQQDRAIASGEVSALAAEAVSLRGAVQRAEGQAEKAGPADLRALVQAYLPEASVRVSLRPAKPAGQAGWQVAQSAIEWTAVEWERVAKFFARAESEPLPWRVVEFSAEPVGVQSGTGRAVLQRLEKTGGAEPNEAP